MAITWDIKRLETDNNNGVNYVHYFAWDVEETGEGLDARKYHGYYDAFIEYTPDPSADGYTAFNALTKEQVIGWVKASLGSEQVTTIESAIATQIAEKKQLQGRTSLPWE
jgi:hypothetical protein